MFFQNDIFNFNLKDTSCLNNKRQTALSAESKLSFQISFVTRQYANLRLRNRHLKGHAIQNSSQNRTSQKRSELWSKNHISIFQSVIHLTEEIIRIWSIWYGTHHPDNIIWFIWNLATMMLGIWSCSWS